MGNLIKSILGKIKSKLVIVNPDCSEFEVNNQLISEFILKKLVPIVGIHPYPLNELMLMVAAVCRLEPTHIFEWGNGYWKICKNFSRNL